MKIGLRIIELRKQIGADPTQLRKHAQEINVTTSQLAEVLAGKKLVGIVTRRPGPPDVDVLAAKKLIVGWFLTFSRRQAIAVEAVKIAREEQRERPYSHTAMLLRRPGCPGPWHGEAEQLAAGKRGESVLIKDLRAAGLHGFRTEEKLMAQGLPFTPDVLFDQPQHICGHKVNWIDAKNALLIPGVSDEENVQKRRKQFENYVEHYGPGAVLWLKWGFSENLVGKPPEVVHFRRTGGQDWSSEASSYRTQLCKNWAAGRCSFGDRCLFAHGEEQLRR